MNTDKFNFFSVDTASPTEKYTQPKVYQVPAGSLAGQYAKPAANTQTMKTRGTGAATKGTNNSTKLG